MEKMIFRCPWCGEKAFSVREKLGYTFLFFKIRNMSGPVRCPHCQQYSRAAIKVGKKRNLYASLFLLLLLGGLMALWAWLDNWTSETVLYVMAAIIGLIFLMSPLFHYFFSHFEKTFFGAAVSRAHEERFSFSVPREGRIWPTVRCGEIYLIQQLLEGKTHAEAPVIYGLLDEVGKSAEEYRIVARIIREDKVKEIKVGDRVRLITDGMLELNGTVVTAPVRHEDVPCTDDWDE